MGPFSHLPAIVLHFPCVSLLVRWVIICKHIHAYSTFKINNRNETLRRHRTPTSYRCPSSLSHTKSVAHMDTCVRPYWCSRFIKKGLIFLIWIRQMKKTSHRFLTMPFGSLQRSACLMSSRPLSGHICKWAAHISGDAFTSNGIIHI